VLKPTNSSLNRSLLGNNNHGEGFIENNYFHVSRDGLQKVISERLQKVIVISLLEFGKRNNHYISTK
jgi:hypothetical protein